MSDNPFDQFDAAPAAPTVAPAAAPAAKPSATANPFDQFDEHSTHETPIHHYQVKDPRGHTYTFDAPEGTSPQELDALSRKAAGYDPNYPVAAPPSAPGVGQQFIDAAKNDAAGIVQGAAALPDMAAEAVGKIMSVVPNVIGQGLRAAGHHDAADWIQNNVTHPLANPVQIGQVVEKVAPTPGTTSGKVARFVSNLAGGAAAVPASAVDAAATRIIGEVPKAPLPVTAPPAAEAAAATKPNYVQLARDLKIRRTPATNSKTGVATVMQSGLGALPGGTPVGQAASNEVGDLATAARNVAENVGQVSNRQGAGGAIAEGANQYKASSKAAATDLYNQRDTAMGGTNAPVSLDNASQAVNDLAAQFPDSPALQQLREHPVIRQVMNALGQAASPEDGQVTLGAATEALSHVRGVLRNLKATSTASPVVISRVGKVEQALEDDVMNGAKAADQAMGREPGAPGSAVAAQKQADAFYADRAAALNGSLKKPLASAADDTKVSGEAVYNQVVGDMDAKSGNLARLRDTWFRLPQQAKSTFAATAIDDLGRATPGQQNDVGTAWSFQSFLTNLNKMSPQARNIVFGSQADDQLQKIATYASRLRDLERARNFSNTAQKYFAGAFMATVGHAVVSGDFHGALEAAAALPATWGGAKLLLSTPAMRDWTAAAMKAAMSGNETAAKVLTNKLGSIAATEPAISGQISALQKAIMNTANDNILARSAASPNANAPNQDQGHKPATSQ